MLQEITEEDINYIDGNMSKKNLLIVYEELREQQKELDLEKYYFRDDFYWNYGILSCAVQRKREQLVCGKTLFGTSTSFVYIDKDSKWIDFVNELKNKYEHLYGWVKNKQQVRRYLSLLLNKLSFTEEYYIKEFAPKVIEEKTGGLLEKVARERLNLPLMEEKKVIVIKEDIDATEKVYKKEEKDEVISDEGIKKYPLKRNGVKVRENAYIYGIEIDGELVYIGKTYRPLKERFSEHIECIFDKDKGGKQQDHLYEAMRNCNGYKFVILFEAHNELTDRELETAERAMIEWKKPRFNWEGVKAPYRYSFEK